MSLIARMKENDLTRLKENHLTLEQCASFLSLEPDVLRRAILKLRPSWAVGFYSGLLRIDRRAVLASFRKALRCKLNSKPAKWLGGRITDRNKAPQWVLEDKDKRRSRLYGKALDAKVQGAVERELRVFEKSPARYARKHTRNQGRDGLELLFDVRRAGRIANRCLPEAVAVVAEMARSLEQEVLRRLRDPACLTNNELTAMLKLVAGSGIRLLKKGSKT